MLRHQDAPDAPGARDDDVLAAAGPVRRLARVLLRDAADPAVVDDVVQETLTRLLEVRERLDRQSLIAYGVVVARNLVASDRRAADLARRHAPRLAEPRTAPGAEEGLLAAEEEAALREALDRLGPDDRELLVAHEVGGRPTAELAAARGSSAGAVAARLARARARLRVDHLLALRRVELPTDRCRSVLDALSLGDARAQQRVAAGRHLLHCPTCAALSEPLLQRRRDLTALLPVPWLLVLGQRAAQAVRAHPVGSSVATAAAGGAVVVAVALSGSPEPPSDRPAAAPAAPAPAAPPAPGPGTLTVDGDPVLPAPGPVAPLGGRVGAAVVATRVPVESVPADEGFWVGTPAARVWVQLSTAGSGAESPQAVQPGRVVSFTGTLAATPPDVPAVHGVTAAEGADELVRQAAHVSVDPAQLVVE